MQAWLGSREAPEASILCMPKWLYLWPHYEAVSGWLKLWLSGSSAWSWSGLTLTQQKKAAEKRKKSHSHMKKKINTSTETETLYPERLNVKPDYLKPGYVAISPQSYSKARSLKHNAMAKAGVARKCGMAAAAKAGSESIENSNRRNCIKWLCQQLMAESWSIS